MAGCGYIPDEGYVQRTERAIAQPMPFGWRDALGAIGAAVIVLAMYLGVAMACYWLVGG